MDSLYNGHLLSVIPGHFVKAGSASRNSKPGSARYWIDSLDFAGVPLSHSHDHQHGDHSHHGHADQPAGKGLKRQHLFMIFGVVLMLVAMAMYLFSMDEAIQPEGPPGEEVPAAPVVAE